MAELEQQNLVRLQGLGFWYPLVVTTLTLGTCATALIHLRQTARLVNTTSLCEGGASV